MDRKPEAAGRERRAAGRERRRVDRKRVLDAPRRASPGNGTNQALSASLASKGSGSNSELAGCQGPKLPTHCLSLGAIFCQIPHDLVNLVDSQPGGSGGGSVSTAAGPCVCRGPASQRRRDGAVGPRLRRASRGTAACPPRVRMSDPRGSARGGSKGSCLTVGTLRQRGARTRARGPAAGGQTQRFGVAAAPRPRAAPTTTAPPWLVSTLAWENFENRTNT